LNAEEDFRQIGVQLKYLLYEGLDISDETYVLLFKAALRMKYPFKTKAELKEERTRKVSREHEICQRLSQIEEEIQENEKRKKKRNIDSTLAEQADLQKELENLTSIEKSGWVLLDFPSNFAQAKLLETALSGFVPNQEADPINREKELGEAAVLAMPTPKEDPPSVLIKSGMDLVLWMELPREECLRRAIGRRYDTASEVMYHVEDVLPLTTSAPLCENLRPVDDESNAEATLLDRFLAFDQGRAGLMKWLKQFGDEEEQMELVQVVNAGQNEEEVFKDIEDIVERVLEVKQGRENELKGDLLA